MAEVTFERFRGLDLSSDPAEVGGETAIACSNVEFDSRGRVKTRKGSQQHNLTTIASLPQSLSATPTYLLAFGRSGGTTLTMTAIDVNGTVTSLGTSATTGHGNSVASIGTPTASYSFFTLTADKTLQRFDPSGPSIANSTGKPYLVAAWQTRLVQANYDLAASSPSGANGSKHAVFFSDPGAPETYTASNYVLLSPGDGEAVVGLTQWRDMLFAVKTTSMFVFYGISTDTTGGAVFNYRRVDLGFHTANTTVASVAGRDGVYIAANEGIYRTTGDVPTRVSTPLDSLFDGSWTPAVGWGGDRLIVTGHPTYDWLVFDPNTGDWTAFDLPGTPNVAPPVGWTISGEERIYYANKSTNVFALDRDATDDAGTSISWSWQSGWYDLGTPNSKRVGPVSLWGTGTATTAVLLDYATTDAYSGSVTLGTAPTVARGRHLRTYRGRLFSHKLSGTGSASISRAGLMLRDQRVS